MANDTETLADVSAWCRDIARSYRNAPANKIEIEGLKVCDYLDELANRIDAAAKREIPQPVGNAAAIRTALKRLRDASRDFYNQILNSQYSGILDKYTCAKQGFPAVLDVRAAIPAANAALAAAPAVECPPSNVAALRAALEKIAHYCDNEQGMDDPYCQDGHTCAEIAQAALSVPPRNCDVGTAEEQAERFARYCHTEVCKRKMCKTRPKALVIDSCALRWSQMQYAAERKGDCDGR